MLKTLLVIVAVASLSGCGGSSKSNDGDDVSSNGGECSKITALSAGYTLRFKIGVPDDFIYTSNTVKEADNKHDIIEVDNPPYQKSTMRSDFYIKGNFKYGTKLTSVINGITMSVEMDPHGLRFPAKKVCDGSKWEDTFTRKDYVNGNEESSQKVTMKAKIEGLNIVKTVEAGEFNTYVIRVDGMHEGSNGWDKFWIDMETGMEVLHEAYDSNGKLLMSWELVDYSN